MSGTLSGNGGRRTVPGRSQYRTPPIGGENRNASGIEPDPSPRISQTSVHTASFWKTIGWLHQSVKSPGPPSPGVVRPIRISPPTKKKASFTM